ncbi:MAG: YgiQ family radical SAM protein [Defluviitaleaceae bacterium]|nr:YgiQ family radical SAM protein [Defluviitaleaceae bacterium]MCL2835594.1 YgiQ family radical SAM protein [Defluviitaleaceae bacterium]
MIYFSEITANLREVPDFLPVSGEELPTPDFVLITGDAYVDHPSFGAALIGKLLWAKGYTVGLIAAPDMNRKNVLEVFGRPKLAFLVTSGSVDSMVNNYAVSLKRRGRDEYAPGGKMGKRPNRAVIAYSNAIRAIFNDVPIILGGLEASLRRMGHFDYWSGEVKRSVLLDSGADLLVYGMGERQILMIADALAAGVSVSDINYIEGTVWKTANADNLPQGVIRLPGFTEIRGSKNAYAKSFKIQYNNTAWQTAAVLSECYGDYTVVQNPPSVPLTRTELDLVYGLKFARMPHPSYSEPVPSIQEVRFSITSSRGCFGGCSFCALSFHQGRHVESRSHESIIREAEELIKLPDFKGYIHDVGGPTANFRAPSCTKSAVSGACANRRCLAPEPCPDLNVSHADYLELLRKLRALPGVKKVFVRSGVRFDYMMLDKDGAFMRELVEHHISGQLKVAPEHVSDNVLKLMGKPKRAVYDAFTARYAKLNEKLGKKQFLVPYLMSSHPGSGLKEAVELAEYLRDNRVQPEQVQDFYPTPGTVSTCMYHTGLNPFTGERVYTARSPREKAMQRALIQYKNPKNRRLVIEALIKAGRGDLIGYGPKCLVRPL